MIERLSFEREMRELGLYRDAEVQKLSPSSVIDSRIDVHAQYSLQRMIFRGDASSRMDGIQILSAVKAEMLAGIYKEDERVPAMLAKKQSLGWWELIPKGRDAALIFDKLNRTKPPIIVFKNDIRSNSSRLDLALRKSWAEFNDIIDGCGGKKTDLSLLNIKSTKGYKKIEDLKLAREQCQSLNTIVELPPPPKVTQKTNSTCWAAALQSIYYATLPDADLTKSIIPPFFSEENNISRVVIEQVRTNNILLNEDQSLKHVHPNANEVAYVYRNVFDLGWVGQVPSSCTNNFWQLLEDTLRENCYVILSYCTPAWRPIIGRWSWHDVVVYKIVTCYGKKKVKVMDPAYGNHVYSDLDSCLNPKGSEWYFTISYRPMHKLWAPKYP